MLKRVTQPLTRWFVVASIAWLTLAPAALRTLSGLLPSSSPWQQICTSHGEKSIHLKGAPGTPQQDESTGSDCPLCILCHVGWAPAPSATPVVDVPLGTLAQLVADTHRPPRPAPGWMLRNPRAPPDFF
ncbi:DUF2946 domain-containing protein [Rhodoferax sediminis]|uniref:DUF2946 domain-containing protein n=1 Tax=Rhodoferax sediminis TaxID=2509614 RepID=A0A515DFP1_9BURK|nr:DUF2946 domain-containing protein [Rhodoferax sediminis]QDL39225.1 DUF2946 domain-containing protein [Rhodoferax sediminis]